MYIISLAPYSLAIFCCAQINFFNDFTVFKHKFLKSLGNEEITQLSQKQGTNKKLVNSYLGAIVQYKNSGSFYNRHPTLH